MGKTIFIGFSFFKTCLNCKAKEYVCKVQGKAQKDQLVRGDNGKAQG